MQSRSMAHLERERGLASILGAPELLAGLRHVARAMHLAQRALGRLRTAALLCRHTNTRPLVSRELCARTSV